MMPGLLDRIGKAIQSPAAQGVLAVGAAGFNPLLGLLAAPGIRNSRDRAKLENDARREELSSAKRRREATDQLAGLLGETATLERPVAGPPELGSAGPVQQAQVPMLATGEGRQKALGLLATASPDTFGGILGEQLFPEQPKPGRLGEQVAMFREVLNRDPTEEEFKSLLGLGDEGSLQDDKTRLEIAKLLRDLQGEAEAESEADESRVRGIQTRLERADKILGLTNQLEGTGLEPGAFAVEGRRPFVSLVGELAGMFGQEDFAKARRDELTAFDVLKKETNIFINDMMSQLSEQGDRTTDSKLRQLQNAAATVEVSPGAIRSVMSEAIQTALDEADRLGVDLEGRNEFERVLNELKSSGPPGSQGASAQYRYNPATGQLEPK